ncbi:HK97 family phage prohead protease [Paraclostridium bifermentans]|uniref:HK97 family phage prohead protease n=1 Tax=Paraclostridium bifermentans TaxID=1490 RepID=UPI00241FC736|nr:HK97 family phage prohead protease [Paraclostridium bifermentans]
MKQNKEIRTLKIKTLEVRALEEDLLIEGLVNNYKESKLMTDYRGNKFVEIVSREVWEESINNNKDNIKLFLNHNDSINIAETLELFTTDEGVKFRAKLIPQARTLYEKIRDNLVSGISFGFIATQEDFKTLSTHKVRYIKSMELQEISILDIDEEPAYYNTEINIIKKGSVINARNDSDDNTNNNDDSSTTFNEVELLQEEVDLLLYSIKNELDYK